MRSTGGRWMMCMGVAFRLQVSARSQCEPVAVSMDSCLDAVRVQGSPLVVFARKNRAMIFREHSDHSTILIITMPEIPNPIDGGKRICVQICGTLCMAIRKVCFQTKRWCTTPTQGTPQSRRRRTL